jgi:hypothetical protein
MNGEMKKCLFEGEQEKCSDYLAKSERHGHVNLTCLWFLDNWLEKKGGAICRLPPPRIQETP